MYWRIHRPIRLAAAVLSLAYGLSPEADAAVNLEWRPTRLSSVVGDIIEVRLFAVSDTGEDAPTSGMTVVLSWDPARLRLLVNVDPCTAGPCDPGTYDWLQSYFPDDSVLDGLNDSFDDGDAFYSALAQLGADNTPVATADGLWVTSFRFAAIGSGVAEIRIEDSCDGCSAETTVSDGLVPGLVVTGTLGPPAEVTVVDCAAPTANAIGSRYLEVTPGPALNPVALMVEGDTSDPDVGCVSMYVQPDGSLAESPAFQTPDDWGTLTVTGPQIRPATEYRVVTDCQAGLSTSTAATAMVRTWAWGDTNGSGSDVTFSDVLRIVDGSNGVFAGDTRLENVDLMPCEPDGIIDDLDISAGQAAQDGEPFPCKTVCVLGPGLADYASFAGCLGGPEVPITVDCEPFDFDLDADCDCFDFAELQTFFGEPLAPP